MKHTIFLFLISGFCLMLLAFIPESKNKAKSNSNLRVTQIAGKVLFNHKKCVDCHTLADEAKGKLTPVLNQRDNNWLAEHLMKESPIVLRQERSQRKQQQVLKAEIAALVDYLYQSKPAEKKQIARMSEDAFQGAYLVYQNNCLNCHSIAGVGKDVAPDLSQVAKRHGDKEWIVEHFMNPQQFSPESIMPRFNRLPKESLEKMAEYLLTLK